MMGSRAVPALLLGRNICRSLRSSKLQGSLILKQQVRHAGDVKMPTAGKVGETFGISGCLYRTISSGPGVGEKMAVVLGSFFWWWVLWHLFTQYDEFFEPRFPNPSEWTDEELGIPPM